MAAFDYPKKIVLESGDGFRTIQLIFPLFLSSENLRGKHACFHFAKSSTLLVLFVFFGRGGSHLGIWFLQLGLDALLVAVQNVVVVRRSAVPNRAKNDNDVTHYVRSAIVKKRCAACKACT